jgi:fumarate reductase subunit D
MNDLNFLQTLIARLSNKSPKFFKVITTLSGITAFITGIPVLLTDLGVTLPPVLLAVENKTIAIAAIAGGLISKLTVADSTVLKK